MKVLPFKIPKKPNENIVLQIDRGESFYDKIHQHEEIQLSFIISGKGKLVIGNRVTTFESGDFVGIGSFLPHFFSTQTYSGEVHMVTLFFTEESFGANFFENQEMLILRPVIEHLKYGFKVVNGADFFTELFFELKNEDKFQLFICLLKLLHYLLGKEKITLTTHAHNLRISKNQGRRLQLVFDHVMRNFQSEIRLDEVAQKIHMSKNAFCRFFKQRTNKTFFQFLAEIRIQHACELIKEQPEMPISEIALQSGYNTISNFNRQFKSIMQVNPSAYRNASIGSL